MRDTLLFDLLAPEEEAVEDVTAGLRFEVGVAHRSARGENPPQADQRMRRLDQSS